MDNGLVVIVDDDIIIVNLLKDILSENGYDVVSFESPTDVEAYALDNPPDLFLLDINMPEIDGLELCRKLKGNPGLEKIPVIFISGALEGREKAKGFDAGGSDYISKPFIARDVLSRVRTHIQLKQSMEEVLSFNSKLEIEIEKRTRELQLAKEKAEKANDAKTLFISQINHELRTPLNGILGMLNLLSKKSPDQELNELYLELADYSARHLSFLINNMLDYTQLENESMIFYYIPFSVKELFNKLENLYKHKCLEKGIVLEIHHPDGSDVFTGDQDRILQVLNNLLTNAVKYASQGTIELRYACDNGLTVSISDDGPGIPEEIREDIFKPFIQEKRQYEKGQNGLGLGLAISKSLVTAMAGSIECTSGEKGTEFTFHIPEHEANCRTESGPDRNPDLHSLSVLLVEDDVVSIYYLEKVLEDAGCRVVQVINGQEALEELTHNSFDLVLMDIGLPGISGLQVLKDIHKIKADFQIPVIAVTAFCQKEDIRHFYESGFADVLVKPVSEKELLRKIQIHAVKQ